MNQGILYYILIQNPRMYCATTNQA